MAISPFGTTSHEDFASTFAFSDFTGFPAVSLAMDHKPIMIPHHQQQPSPPMTADGSPQLSGPPLASGEDDLEEDEDDDDLKSSPSSTNADDKRRGSTDASNTQGVKRNGKASSAERRATHNAIERARRESLNGRFLELANALPTMANVKRPSKSVIVNKSLEWIYESQIREHTLVRENNALRAELNEMRARLQMPPVATPPHTNAYGPQADMAARLKAAQSVPAAATGADSYFSSLGPFAPLAAMHHPLQYPSFAANHGNGPNSAPLPALPRTLGATAPGAGGIFAGFGQTPYPTGAAPAQQVKAPQPASPMSKTGSVSDSGSEHAQSPTGSATGSGAANSPSTAPAEMPVQTPAAVEANLTALQVAHFQAQQQQFAAFAAAVAQQQQQQTQAGQTAGVPAGWPMNAGFMF